MDIDIKNYENIFDLMGHNMAIQRLSQQIEPVARFSTLALPRRARGRSLCVGLTRKGQPETLRPRSGARGVGVPIFGGLIEVNPTDR